MIWTRVTPDAQQTEIPVQWEIAADTAFSAPLVQTGSGTALAERDFTFKAEVSGLQPGTTYYYRFIASGKRSLIGRAKTCPVGPVEELKFAVVACANYETGYYAAYQSIAQRNDLDALLHLGDYIYEYEAGHNGIFLPQRQNEPMNEAVTLADYRTRYSLYRLDTHLMRLHQQHAFIHVWDDHESANDSWTGGAFNHQSNEGSWEVRKAVSRRVYYEWMPVREQPDQKIYRRVAYGPLCDVLMLDTRLDGRDAPPPTFDTPDQPPRHIISDAQYRWLTNALQSSRAQWKVIGNQVLFSTTNFGFAAGFQLNVLDSIRKYEYPFIFNWESYPTQRNGIIDTLRQRHISNTVIVSGDTHSSWAFDVTPLPVLYPLAANNYSPQPNPYNATTQQGYNPATGEGSWAVEFGIPSISSPNFDENFGSSRSNLLESLVNTPLPFFNVNYNPHLKYVDLDRHGYVILTLTPDIAQADYYYISNVRDPNATAAFGQAATTFDRENKVRLGSVPRPPKPVQDIPTPPARMATSSTQQPDAKEALILGCFPNPLQSKLFVQISFSKKTTASVYLTDLSGRRIQEIAPPQGYEAGTYNLGASVASLPSGVYQLAVQRQDGTILGIRQLIK
jgi:alkaline phosphatase D